MCSEGCAEGQSGTCVRSLDHGSGEAIRHVDHDVQRARIARDALLAQTPAKGARLVLVGGFARLGSFETRHSFNQLQDIGMATLKLGKNRPPVELSHPRGGQELAAGDAAKALAALDAGGAIIEQPDIETRQAILARDSGRLSRQERARTLVLDPTRQGRQEPIDAIRAALVRDGTLEKGAVVVIVLETRDFHPPQARLTTFRPGDIVVFRQAERGQARAGASHRVRAVDAATGIVRLQPDKRAKQRAS